ncbi:MAG: hypothetical protein HXS52_11855 [Theionarchaea archaeon]|nr:hypothetical protein [Theionarchaea archaeon]
MNAVIEVLKVLLSALRNLIIEISVEEIRFRHQRKIEMRQKIGSHINRVYPLIEDLIKDVEYCLNEQTRIRFDEESLDRTCEKIKGAFLEYKKWYNEFGMGIQLELEYVDNILLENLKILLRYSNLVNNSNFHIIERREQSNAS